MCRTKRLKRGHGGEDPGDEGGSLGLELFSFLLFFFSVHLTRFSLFTQHTPWTRILPDVWLGRLALINRRCLLSPNVMITTVFGKIILYFHFFYFHLFSAFVDHFFKNQLEVMYFTICELRLKVSINGSNLPNNAKNIEVVLPVFHLIIRQYEIVYFKCYAW